MHMTMLCILPLYTVVYFVEEVSILANYSSSIYCAWICFRLICRDDGYIYDDNEDDSYSAKDADFSLKPCSKSKKRPLEKVQNLHSHIHI
jgi:hypothetical protein